MTLKLKSIVKETSPSPDAVVIWLHGLGADGLDFLGALPYLNLDVSLSIRFIFPSAPIRAVTINNGMEMPSWYDIKAMSPHRVVDVLELEESVSNINQIIAEQLDQGIELARIMLVGFSQGGALAYETALCGNYPITAVAAMSTYLPRLDSDAAYAVKREVNVLCIHGSADNVVPYSLGEQSMSCLKAKGLDPKWHVFPMGHEVSIDSLATLGDWINDHLISNRV